MQIAYILALLLIAPYFCSAGFSIDSLTNTKTNKDKDTCPTYTCLKTLATDCKTKLEKNKIPISDNILCEIFEEILSKDAAEFTDKEGQEMMDKYAPILCCIVEATGLAECGKDDKGEFELKVAEDLTQFSVTFGPKCLKELASGQLPAEVFNMDLLGDLKTQFEKVIEICGDPNLAENPAKMLGCLGGVLKAFNAACKKTDKETFCPDRKDTY